MLRLVEITPKVMLYLYIYIYFDELQQGKGHMNNIIILIYAVLKIFEFSYCGLNMSYRKICLESGMNRFGAILQCIHPICQVNLS